MKTKLILVGAGIALAVSAGTVQAAEKFATLADVPAVKLTGKQAADVRGANHVIRLVQFRTGRTLPTDAAIQATTAAGSIGGVGNDRPAIVALLP